MRRFSIVLATAAAAAFPATAAGADGPSVIRIDPSTGARTALAGGAPWHRLSSIAVGPSGTVYVADQTPHAGGIYSLTAPGFAITPFATTVPTENPLALAASGSTVYSLDDAAGVVSIDANAPFMQKILSPPQVVDEGEPLNPFSFALSGSTLYGIASSDCVGEDSAGESSYASVVAIETATGDRTFPTDLGCSDPTAIEAAPDGSLLIAMPAGDRTPATIIRRNPVSGLTTTVAKGGALRNPVDLALAPSGDLIVADLTSGVLRISTQTGKQATIASGGDLNHVNAVAVDASGGIYAAAPGGPAAVLDVSAPKRERFSAAGVKLTAACRPRCTLGYSMTWDDPINGSPIRVGTKQSVRLKFPALTKRSVTRYLRNHRTAPVTLTMRPEDGHRHALGEAVTMSVVLTR